MPSKLYKFVALFMLLWSSVVGAQTRITLYNPHPLSHEMIPILLLLVKTANSIQSDIEFTIAHRPGGEQLIAFNAARENPENSVVLISAVYIGHLSTGKIKPNQITPVLHLGYACWGVYRTWTDPRDINMMVVGHVSPGDSTQLTALQVAEKLGLNSHYVPFRTFPNDAMNVMIGSGDINFSIFPIKHIGWMQDKNPKINLLAYNCQNRHPQYPAIPTLAELGIRAPRPFNMLVGGREMNPQLKAQVSDILTRAQNSIGRDRLNEMSSYVVPTIRNLDGEFQSLITDQMYYLDKYKTIIAR